MLTLKRRFKKGTSKSLLFLVMLIGNQMVAQDLSVRVEMEIMQCRYNALNDNGTDFANE
jgi:hypothetical protein